MSASGPTVATPDRAAVSLTIADLDRLISTLRDDGHAVVGPIARDNVLTLDEITGADDLPRGWLDEQSPGKYRATPSEADTAFAHGPPSLSWKRFLHEERTLVISTSRTNGTMVIDPPPAGSDKPLAFFGIQACDLAAIGVLDVVLADDPAYRRRRDDLLVVAASCTDSVATCFCVSAGTGPRPGPLADIVLTELADGSLIADAQTERGAAVLTRAGLDTAATEGDCQSAAALVDTAAARQTRHLDTEAIALAAAAPDDTGWDDVAERCLTCGNCTMVCPTCFCTSISDQTRLDDGGAERWQTWASCFSLDYAYVHGGSVRTSPSSRYRQWYLHKLVTWHDQFDSSGCVGCGRCITWCPTGIDITEAIIS
jgi:ferredoxin